jgi:prepilin-type N-terminal cleavage/methylation domain-containing protein
MPRDERGFTLVEILTALMILGVITAVALPVFLEWRGAQHLASQRFEAQLLLQERMERLQRDPDLHSTRGAEERRGEAAKGTVYRIAWKKEIRGHLVRTDVMVAWKDAQGIDREMRLRGLQFVP